ncbi:MAG: 16S rRNA (adenine(1518)-N(6)/adenine(1519)-N(6))-dimethyltransferase, partial [Gammaproteobacteria bacterium]|nr:16S rRNA (adenine(1518)-N(6)/adenine(1519)-N(6))-dimethyltransferase [Gammaproteobacteria bacterium]
MQRIVAALHPRPGDHMVEIGPGRGALTRPLLAAVGALDVIELDRDLIPLLEQQYAGLGELRIHQADALRFDFTTLVKNGERLRTTADSTL